MDLSLLPRCRKTANTRRAYQAAVNESPRNATSGNPRGRTLAAGDKLWEPGRTLWVSFMGAPDRQWKMEVYELGCQWVDLSDANLTLELCEDNDQSAQIRIKLDPAAPHNESDLGTDALIGEFETMILNVRPDNAHFRKTVLHEFGHALGMMHEHQHPDSNIAWNEAIVVEAYTHAGWAEADIRAQMFAVNSSLGLVKTAYDPASVMHYPIASNFTLNGFHVGFNEALSEKDLECMRLAYPND